MSLIKRISNIWKSQKSEPAPADFNPYEDAQVGDIVRVDLQEYVITGKVAYFDRGFAPHRFAYYIRDGKRVSLLLVEKGRTYDCFLLSFLEGALDDPNDVPTRLEVDGQITYELEHRRQDVTRTSGQTDFRSGDDIVFWRYFAGGDRVFILQWQDGKFVAAQGEQVPASDVAVLRGSK